MKLQEVNPHNYGWYEVKLDPFTVDHLWECIDQKEESMKDRLAGQIDQSYKIPVSYTHLTLPTICSV